MLILPDEHNQRAGSAKSASRLRRFEAAGRLEALGAFRNMHTTPPTYLSKFAAPTAGGSPANLLTDGTWCGHGEPLFGVYDIRSADSSLFAVHLPSSREYPELPAITATSASSETFFLYDPREHPASLYGFDRRKHYPHKPAAPFVCPSCGNESFAVAVGFEMPSDSEQPNDTSWFALAVECSKCKWREIIFDDETA